MNDETDRRLAGGGVAQSPSADALLPSSWAHTLPHSDTSALLASAARVVGHAALASKKQRYKQNEDVPPLCESFKQFVCERYIVIGRFWHIV
jgi:hypothetical protein